MVNGLSSVVRKEIEQVVGRQDLVRNREEVSHRP